MDEYCFEGEQQNYSPHNIVEIVEYGVEHLEEGNEEVDEAISFTSPGSGIGDPLFLCGNSRLLRCRQEGSPPPLWQ